VWADITIDFIEGLPKVNGWSVILTVVDRFSKAAHFLPPGHPYTATTVTGVFFDHIVKLHGVPNSIVSDRDPKFTSHFWPTIALGSGCDGYHGQSIATILRSSHPFRIHHSTSFTVATLQLCARTRRVKPA
jgi:hypothetical protein